MIAFQKCLSVHTHTWYLKCAAEGYGHHDIKRHLMVVGAIVIYV
jgi:hypothetical protein